MSDVTLGTGIALQGEPRQAINIWERDRARSLAAADAAAKARAKAQEEDDKAFAKASDLKIEKGKYLPFYEKQISNEGVKLINDLHKLRKDNPTTWQNLSTNLLYDFQNKAATMLAQSEQAKENLKNEREGKIILPKNYGITMMNPNAAWKDLSNPENGIYGILEQSTPDGMVLLGGAPPPVYDDAKAADAFHKDETHYDPTGNPLQKKIQGAMYTIPVFNPYKQSVDDFISIETKNPAIRANFYHKYPDEYAELSKTMSPDQAINTLIANHREPLRKPKYGTPNYNQDPNPKEPKQLAKEGFYNEDTGLTYKKGYSDMRVISNTDAITGKPTYVFTLDTKNQDGTSKGDTEFVLPVVKDITIYKDEKKASDPATPNSWFADPANKAGTKKGVEDVKGTMRSIGYDPKTKEMWVNFSESTTTGMGSSTGGDGASERTSMSEKDRTTIKVPWTREVKAALIKEYGFDVLNKAAELAKRQYGVDINYIKSTANQAPKAVTPKTQKANTTKTADPNDPAGLF